MSCQQIREQLDSYLDGNLDEPSRQTLRRHLERCSACRDLERRKREVVRRVAELDPSIEPERDLWPGIAGRLDVRPGARATSSPWWHAVAAASVAAALLAAGYFARDLLAPGDAPAPIPIGTSGVTAMPAAEPLSLERSFLDAQRRLREELEERRAMLSPETVQAVESNLAIIDTSIKQIRSALGADPGNRELNRLLVAAHQRRISLLEQATELSARL